jgi:two-component system chemotaxis sensor kinase CheA
MTLSVPSATRQSKSPKPAASAVDAAVKEDETGKSANQPIRVTVDTLEQLMTMVSKLVLTRNQLLEIVRRHEESEFKTPLQRLSNVTAELQEGVMKTRMQPIGNAWQKLPRIVRDLSNELGKKIDLEMQGADTELDRQVLDLIKDPLTHMVRNSADHGLETAEERRAVGKPEHGLIRLSAYHEGGYIIIRNPHSRMMGAGSTLGRSRQKPSRRAWFPRSTRRNCRKPRFTSSYSRRVFPRRRKSPTYPAVVSAWTLSATTSIRSAERST